MSSIAAPISGEGPGLVVVGGVHGAGKSSYCRELVAASGWAFLTNQELRREHPRGAELTRADVHALLRERAAQCFDSGRSFVFEHVMSGRFVERLLAGAREHGFATHLAYLDVRDADLALARVDARVLDGGHDVEREQLAARLDQSRANFWLRYRPLADSWELFDNSGPARRLVARGRARAELGADGASEERLELEILERFVAQVEAGRPRLTS